MSTVEFFFNDPATTEIYTLSLPDALPISATLGASGRHARTAHRVLADLPAEREAPRSGAPGDRRAERPRVVGGPIGAAGVYVPGGLGRRVAHRGAGRGRGPCPEPGI